MTNKDFVNTELNGMHIRFYHEAVLNSHAQYTQKSTATAKQIAEWAIEDAQELMRVMGYTNVMETDDD